MSDTHFSQSHYSLPLRRQYIPVASTPSVWWYEYQLCCHFYYYYYYYYSPWSLWMDRSDGQFCGVFLFWRGRFLDFSGYPKSSKNLSFVWKFGNVGTTCLQKVICNSTSAAHGYPSFFDVFDLIELTFQTWRCCKYSIERCHCLQVGIPNRIIRNGRWSPWSSTAGENITSELQLGWQHNNSFKEKANQSILESFLFRVTSCIFLN